MNIIQQADACRFIAHITNAPEDKHAKLEYELLDNHTINFSHTYVPFRLRGKGYAEALVEAGLAWARKEKFNIKTSCWYVEKFIEAEKQK